MNAAGRFYSFLAEMLLILLFFSVSAAVLLKMFVRAGEESRQTALRTEALISVQSMMEQSAADGRERVMTFETDGTEYTVTVAVKEESKGSGILRRVVSDAVSADGVKLLSAPMETAVFLGEKP